MYVLCLVPTLACRTVNMIISILGLGGVSEQTGRDFANGRKVPQQPTVESLGKIILGGSDLIGRAVLNASVHDENMPQCCPSYFRNRNFTQN